MNPETETYSRDPEIRIEAGMTVGGDDDFALNGI